MENQNDKKSNENIPNNTENTSCGMNDSGGGCACSKSKGLHKILFVFVIALLAVTYALSQGGKMSAEAEKMWLTDYTEAKKIAANQNKPILISFHTSWCGWCKKMKADVYSDQDFCDFATEKLVLLLLDGDKDTDLVAKFGIQGYPSYVIQNSKGETLKSFSGYMKTDKFISTIKQATN